MWIFSAGTEQTILGVILTILEVRRKKIERLLNTVVLVNCWPDGNNLRARSFCACILCLNVFIPALPFSPLNVVFRKAEYEFEFVLSNQKSLFT